MTEIILENISFVPQMIYPNTSQYVRNEWAICGEPIFPNYVPRINYCFYGSGSINEEKLLVIDDSSTVIFLTKMVRISKGEIRSSSYAIVRSKLIYIEMLTGTIITELNSSPEEINNALQRYYNITIEKYNNTINPFDLLCYYIPKESGKNLHVILTENKTEYERDPKTRIDNIKSTNDLQTKRVLFGNFQIDRNFNTIFGLTDSSS